jgi:lysophospholipase L1-like esterase
MGSRGRVRPAGRHGRRARFDRALSLYLPSDTCLPNWKSALGRSRAGGAVASVGTRGDSTTLGVIGGGGNGTSAAYNPSSLSKPQDISWADRARKYLATSLALGGTVAEAITAPSTADTRFTAGSGWTIASAQISCAASAAGTLTFVDDNQANAWDLVILKQGNSTTVPVTIDGASATIDTSAQTNNTSKAYRITTGSVGTHTLVFSAPASGTYTIYKLDPTNTTTPPVAKIARFGISGQQFITGLIPGTTTVGSNMHALINAGYDLMVLWMGINDMHFAGATVSQYKTGLQQFVTAMQAANCDVILTAFPSRGYAATGAGDYEQLAWHQAIYDVADQYNCPVWDLQKRWGYGYRNVRYAVGNGWPLYDGTHPTLAGYSDAGRSFANILARVA